MSIKKPTPLDSFASNGVNKIEKFTPLDKASYGYLTGLIDKLCPDGVAFRALSEIGRRNKGVNITATKMKEIHQENAPVKIFAGGSTVANIPYSAISLKNIITDPSIIVKSRGYIGFEYYDQPFSHKNELWSYTINSPQVNQKFVYYYLLTQTEKLQRLAKATSVKIPQLSVADTDKLLIPIPPLAVQKEIVKILDNFTQLEAELEARKKQYEHYREALLSFDDGVEFKALKNICDVRDGTHDSPKKSLEGMPLVTSKNIKNNDIDLSTSYLISISDFEQINKRSKVDKWDVLISMIGTVGETALVNKKTSFAIKNVGLIKVGNETLAKFISYYLKSRKARKHIHSTQNGLTQKFLSLTMLRHFPVPIPPLTEQKRIVAILDKFDALVNDISTGLPAEIAARKKQYGYYRNQLLAFTPLDSFASNGVNSR